jgi:hypothetical protein
MVDSKGIGKDMGSLKNFCKSQTTRTPLGVETEKKSTLCGKKALPINLGNTIPTYMVGESLSTHLVWEEVSISKITIFNCFFQSYRTQSKLTSNLDILQSRNKQLTTVAQNITAKTDTKKGQRYHTNKELETNNTLQL